MNVLKISTQKQLLLDDFIIEDCWNLKRKLRQPEKFTGNPVMKKDFPWEFSGPMAGTVLYDENSGEFTMWYLIYDVETSRARKNRITPPASDMNPVRDFKKRKEDLGPSSYLLCVAKSEDGLRWNRILNFPYRKHEKTSIVFTGHSEAEGHFVMRLPDNPPDKRFLLWYLDWHGYANGGMCLAYSPDGISWKPYENNPVIYGHSDCANCILRDEKNNRWIAIMRPWDSAGQNWIPNRHVRRRITATTSSDLINWEYPFTIMYPDELDPDDLYGMPSFSYEGIYFGQLLMYYHNTQTMDSQLAWSRDGLKWDRLPERPIFIPLGEKGSFDGCMAIPSFSPVIVGDEIWFYYTGSAYKHDSPVKNTGVGLAKLKKDRLISHDAGNGPGVLLTRPFIIEGDKLFINIDSKNGEARIAIVEPDLFEPGGKVCQGFDKDDCDAIIADKTEHQVTWKGNPSISSLKGKIVRLKFWLNNASIYSFQIK